MNEHVFNEWFSLEETCPKCEGSGTQFYPEEIGEFSKAHPCGCDRGMVPTEFGKMILNFLQRRVRITQNARIDFDKR